MSKKTVGIITLGCKVNQYESNGFAKQLQDNNFDVLFKIDESVDAYILNTCAVTNESEKKSRGYIAKIRKVSPNARLYICGCASQHDPMQFAKFEGVNAIIGDYNKHNLVDRIIADFRLDEEVLIEINCNNIYIDNAPTNAYDDFKMTKGERTRCVIKIQDGCNNFCAYCLIPYLRGRERSRQLESILNEVKVRANEVKEIIFTGINMSNYGKDFNDGTSLKDIAIMMRQFPSVRFRFSSLEQNVIDDEFMRILAETPNFAPHFHLSLQSGANKTLKDMNRKYNSDEYYSKLEIIRKYFDNSAITTDIIVGFPTETEDDFNETYEFAKKCQFSKIHIFPFSPRSGTLASKMKNIATNVKERERRLFELSEVMQKEYYQSQIGKELTVIIERERDGYYEGYSENYIKCYISSKTNFIKHNDCMKVKVLSLFNDGVKTEILR